MGTSNEVAVRNENAVAVANLGEWGDHEVSQNDLIIPQILPMQGLSELVTEGKAAMGEFRDSLTGKLIGKAGEKSFEVIPFHCQEVFSIQAQQADGSFKYHSTEPIIKSPMKEGYNDNLPWEDKMMIDGTMTPIKRYRRYNFFVLLRDEVNAGEGAMPYFISFKSTSVKEGKKLFNMMYVRNRSAGLPPAAYSFVIDGRREKNDKGTFIVPTVEQGSKVSAAELGEALKWFKLVSKGAAKTHDVEEAAPTAADSSSTGDF